MKRKWLNFTFCISYKNKFVAAIPVCSCLLQWRLISVQLQYPNPLSCLFFVYFFFSTRFVNVAIKIPTLLATRDGGERRHYHNGVWDFT